MFQELGLECDLEMRGDGKIFLEVAVAVVEGRLACLALVTGVWRWDGFRLFLLPPFLVGQFSGMIIWGGVIGDLTLE